MFILIGILLKGLITIQTDEDNYEHLPVQHIIHDFDIIELESPLSVLPVEEQMTWRRGYEYCKSLSRRLVYVSPSVRADFQYMYEDINCGCNITFWTAHQVSNHTVVKAQRYYDNFPLDNIKEDSSLLLCVFLVYESVNKIIGWEADECNDSNARHGLICDIVFPQDKKIMTLYIANLTWTDANDFCEERNSSLMLENGPFTYGELDYLLDKGYWSNTRINSFWTYHRTSNYVSTVSLLPINSSSYNADIGGSYCAYVVIERPLEPNKLTWMSDFCFNSSRSFICESESEEFYYTQFENVRPVGQGLNIVFEVRLTSLADCLLKCNESTENGIPCELFVWNKLNSTCQLLNIQQAALPFNESKCCYWDETSKQYEMHVAEGCTTYDRFIYTPRIVEDYPSGDEITTLENDGPLSTTINAKLTEALSLLQSSRTMPVHHLSGAKKPVSIPNTEGHIYLLMSVLVVAVASSIGMLVFIKYLTMTLKKHRRPKEDNIIHMIYENKQENIDCMSEICDDDDLPKMYFKNNPPMCHIDMIE